MAGIIVAAVFGSALVLAAIILMRKRRQRKADTDEYTSEKPGDTDKTVCFQQAMQREVLLI